MNTRIVLLMLFVASGLAACQPSVVSVPTPVATPGPAGPQGATGVQGDKGKAGGDTTLIVVPPAASAPSN